MTVVDLNSTAFNLHPSSGAVLFSRLFKPYQKRFIQGILLLVATNMVALTMPRLVNIGVQMVEGKAIDFYFDHMFGLVILMMGLALIGAIARTFSRQVIFNIGRDVERDLRSHLFYHLSLMSSDFFARRSVGDLMTHLNSDINNVRLFTGFAALNFFNIVIVFCGTIPILISMDPVIAAAALAPFVLVMTSAQALTGRMFRCVRDYQASLAKLTEHVQENLSGAQIIRLFHQEEAENRKFESTNHRTYESALGLAKIRIIMFPLMRMMGSLGVAAALFVGGREVALGRITLGDYVEINARLLQLAWPAISFGFIMSVYAQGKASLARLNELFIVRPTIVDGSYRSPVLSKIVVENLSFTTQSGQMIGIVGRSGSGKSTLLRMLSRELQVPRGQIKLDDVDINDWNLNDLHERMAVVSSEPFLFSATLRENICFARSDATDDEVAEVMRQVNLSLDVNTVVGERGVMLSGGQRQRVALARALLTKASILLLDDCLSAVDSETEQHIIAELLEKRAKSWLILVSHRLAPMRYANEILVLQEGQVIDRGKHDELIHRDGLYAKLWGVQQLQESLEHD